MQSRYNNNRILKILAFTSFVSLLVPVSCGEKQESNLKAVGYNPTELPGKIEAEHFTAALDLTPGNQGTECGSRNGADVDVEATSDVGGGCNINGTQSGEVLDYLVFNKSDKPLRFTLEVRVASAREGSSITIESPVGTTAGKISAYATGYTPGWQNWVTRRIENVKINPGLQVIRIKVDTGETNLNWIAFVGDNPEAGATQLANTAENAFINSCAKCHSYFLENGTVNRSEIAKRAVAINNRIIDSVSPMPPKGSPSDLQISTDEKNAIIGYVSGLVSAPLVQEKPLATKDFESKGMKLRRDLMAENAGHIWGMVFLPDGDILATIKTGEVKRFDVKSRKFVNVEGAPRVANYGQGGLLDVGISPDFGDDRKVYLTYAKEVSSGQYTTALGTAELRDDRLINFKEIFVAKGSNGKGEHFGGRIVIDEDSSIWLTVGERNDRTNAQRLDNHLGKVLHLTEAGKAHPGNPFIKDGRGLAEIYSYGHRNQQGLTRNALTGEIWEQEHGQKGGDEINIIKPGLNYGWPLTTYGVEYNGEYLAPTSYPGTEQPLVYYTPSIAPSGLVVYSSDNLKAWKGLAISGALALMHLNLTEIKDNKKASEERLFVGEYRIREVEQSPTGEVWYSSDTGQLFRIRRAN